MLIVLLFITLCSIVHAEKPAGKHGFLFGAAAANTASITSLSNLPQNDIVTAPQNKLNKNTLSQREKDLPAAAALDGPCTVPTNNMLITNDTWFCNTPEDRYYLSNGIDIGASDITVDCNNVTLYGTTQIDDGIYFDNVDNVTLINCHIEKYEYGIRLDYSSNNKLDNINSSDNYYAGILLYYSPDTEISNSICSFNNNRGVFFYIIQTIT